MSSTTSCSPHHARHRDAAVLRDPDRVRVREPDAAAADRRPRRGSPQAWRNVEDALSRAGATLGDIISVPQWLVDAADINAYAAVRTAVITHQPVVMLAVVPALVWPNMRVEIEVTAIRLTTASPSDVA
jgi:Endoribonuclease L-PSP